MVATRPGGVPPGLPGPRLGGTRSRGDLGHHAFDRASGAGGGGAGRRGRGRHRPNQPARDHRRSGTGRPAARSTTPSSGRTAALRPTAASWRPRARGAAGAARGAAYCSTPYFSATKAGLDPVARRWRSADSPAPAASPFGTVDSFLVWRLTGGRVHATDATNASRTGPVRHSRRSDWSDDLLRYVRAAAAPCCRRCATAQATFGLTSPELFGSADSRSAASSATSRAPPSASAASHRAM